MASEFITRKIKREYNEILLKGAEVGAGGDFKIAADNAEKANDYLVKAMTDKTQEEIDNMDSKEFDKLAKKFTKMMTNPSERGIKED